MKCACDIFDISYLIPEHFIAQSIYAFFFFIITSSEGKPQK